MKRFLLSQELENYLLIVSFNVTIPLLPLVLILGLATLIGTLISDIVMSIVDPRIRIQKTRRKGDKMELTEEKEKKSYKKVFHQWAFG